MFETKCQECGQAFDLLDIVAADEWYNGHDCEDGYNKSWTKVMNG